MQAAVSSAGEADNYALLLILKHQADSRRVVRHFVCSECLGMLEAVQGRHYLHDCEGDSLHRDGDTYGDARALSAGRFNGVSG